MLRDVVIEGYGVIYVSTSRTRVAFAAPRPPDSVVCKFCRDILRAPRRARCGHVFCAVCAQRAERDTGTCPTCKSELDVEGGNEWIPDETIALDVSNLPTHCPYAWRRATSGGESTFDYRGFGHRCCGAVVRFADLERHVRECAFATVICGLVEMENGRASVNSCEETCLRCELEAHRKDCAYAETTCVNASYGCEWSGSAMHVRDHELEPCAFAPKACRHGCGATTVSEDAASKHEDVCPVKMVACGFIDEEDSNEETKRCPTTMQRNALAHHREQMCEYARQITCADCRASVSARSVIRHKQTCVKVRRPCTAGCGTMLTNVEMPFHVESICPVVEIQCAFHEVGCVVRCRRSEMERHYADAGAAHDKLLLRASEEVREFSEKLASIVDGVKRDEEGLNEADRVERDSLIKSLREEEIRVLEDIKTLRENEADARKRNELYAEALKKALVDQAETYEAALAEMREELSNVREEFAAYKERSVLELSALQQTVDATRVAMREVSNRASLLTRGGGIFDEHRANIMKELDDDRKKTMDEIERAMRQLRFEFDDAKSQHGRELVSIREDIRTVLGGRLGRR
jgi:hypothetical protein